MQTRDNEKNRRISCSVGPTVSSGHQNGLLKFTFDRTRFHGATRRVPREQGQSVFSSTQCEWVEAGWTRLVLKTMFFSRGNGFPA